METVVQLIHKLKQAIPVEWDRFTVTNDKFYVVYGWIARSDGQRDFVMIQMWDTDNDDPEDVFYTTSSAKFSPEISRVLYGSANDHNPCRKIDELLAMAQLPSPQHPT